ncbi:MAG TPA: ABC transporter ATP-binding protein [Verrucomicrobiae bacterium]|jgi:simple sugar transport system ATP-binding protein|nr:ABC transporter ATP-binding protein [Verrucomicrobiae bacterium]
MSDELQSTVPPRLELVNIVKRFGPMTAVDHISLKLEPGTFHALLGENGAGKSTLVKCVMGFHPADEGDILVRDHSRDIRSPHDAQKFGIGMVYQHFTLVPSMTVAENLLLPRNDIPAVIDWKSEWRRLEEFLATAPFKVDLQMPASQLAAGQKQKAEILKQLYLQSRILILDEPTSVLTPQEADEVLGLLRQMVLAKKLSIILITHKFKQVTDFCDEITVMRRGKFAGAGKVKDLTVADMSRMMLGEQRVVAAVKRVEREVGPPALEISNLCADKDNGLPGIKNASLTVRAGEIVGIAGVSGNGQRELVEVLGGQRSATGGTVNAVGKPYHATRREMVERQIFALPEEPLRNACVPNMSVEGNLALRLFDHPPQARAKWVLSQRAIRKRATDLIHRFNIRTPSSLTPVRNLSGGNVQRTVLARELSSGAPRLIIAANPCFGLDFNAVEFIHGKIMEARNNGVGVLLLSEDLDELLAMADRVIVMAGGEFVYETPALGADLNVIGQKMAGH